MPQEVTYDFSSAIQKKIVAMLLFEGGELLGDLDKVRPELFDHPALSDIVTLLMAFYQKYHRQPSLEEVATEFEELLQRNPRKDPEEFNVVFSAVLDQADSNYDYVRDKVVEFARHQAIRNVINDAGEKLRKFKSVDTVLDDMKSALAIGEGHPQDEWVIDAVCAADVPEEQVEWLWYNTFPKAALSVVMGMPGLGKSWFLAMVAARISTGRPFPSHAHIGPKPGSVIILQAEDDIRTQWKRRLRLEGADSRRIHFIRGLVRSSDGTRRALDLTSDVERLRQKMHELGDVQLIIVDPLSAYVGLASRMDSHKERDVRLALSPLESLIESERVAVLGIMHLNKNQMADAIFRVSGSAAWAQVPRMLWVIARNNEDHELRSFLVAKHNPISEVDAAEGEFCFRIDRESHCLTVVADVQPGDVKEALAAPSADDAKDRRTKTKMAVDVLEGLRADHVTFVPADDMMKEFPNISKSIWWRAREQAGVRTRKSPDDGRWIWML